MTESTLPPEYRVALRAALQRAYTICPHANMLLLCEQAAAPDDSVAASVQAWQVGRIQGKTQQLAFLQNEDMTQEVTPTMGIGIPAELYAQGAELRDEFVELAASVKEELLSRVEITLVDEALFRAAARSALESTSGDQVFLMAPSDSEKAKFFSVQELHAGEYGIVIPATWICLPRLLTRAEEILLEESLGAARASAPSN